MLKTDSLILLVNSLTKAEKKSFKLNSKDSEYLDLFNIINEYKEITATELKKEFLTGKNHVNFDIAVAYLYKRLLDTLLRLREEQDDHYSLFNKILKARVLFEKSIFDEAMDLLQEVKKAAEKKENYYALLYASRLELEYLLMINFANISETELLNRHLKLSEILKSIRKINEQLSLYELLKHRIIYKGNIRSQKQKESLNDLVVSEMSIVASSDVENFEIKKLHQLFQSIYLIGVGDYKSALHSYYELNSLFENNKHLWTNPPIYYLQVIEGILDNLRCIRSYDEMFYFIEQLKKFNYTSVNFQADVKCLIFFYELFPLLDRGKFKECKLHLKEHSEVLEKVHLLSMTRQTEIFLYQALVCIGNKDLKNAQKALQHIIIRGKNFYYLPLYKTIRQVNLMVLYELGNFEFIDSETRSIKREINKSEKAYRLERLMCQFLTNSKVSLFQEERIRLWKKLEPELISLRNDVYEMQILKLFDFTAWIESKLLKIPLSEALKNRI